MFTLPGNVSARSFFLFYILLALCAALFWPDPGSAAGDGVKPGCEFKPIDLKTYGFKDFEEAKIIRSHDGFLETTLRVAYAEHELAGCKTRLRNYNGELIGPTLRLQPGDTLKIRLQNALPEETAEMPDDINTPHNFNVTNFHSHGLHVSPAGNSDNVLINIRPGVDFDVEISIPRDHPTGTFWYHAHVHGSTALQVSSGMAGALIIEDKKSMRSLDSMHSILEMQEKVLLFQQIGYDEQGVIENYDCFGPSGGSGCNWLNSKRHTTINGQFAPTIRMRQGEVQRWRLIHGGIRESLNLVLLDEQGSALPLYEIAVDGLSLGYIDRWKKLTLEPGYRSDVLVKAPRLKGKSPQTFLLYDAASSAEEGLRDRPETQKLLARVIVSEQGSAMDLPCNTFNDPKGCPDMWLTRPHQNITDEELTGKKQSVTFNIGSMVCPKDPSEPCEPCKQGEDCKTRFMINQRPFSPVNVRKLELGTASEWELSSDFVNHPFHIHVNPFQYTRKNPDGKDEIIWRDTLLIRDEDPPVKIRSRYERYIGRFVLHCHILDHEDQGMMELVEVELPGGNAHQH